MFRERAVRRRPPLSLDATVDDGLSVHEVIAAPTTIDDDEQLEKSAESDAVPVLATLANDLLEVKALDNTARQAETEAVRLRAMHEQRRAEFEARVAEYLEAEKLAALAGLTTAELKVVHARITLTQNGEPITHSEVGRMLGVKAGTASKLWQRAQARRAGLSKPAGSV